MNTRLIAARVLYKILQDGSSLTATLDTALIAVESSKDRAFIQALCYGVLRQFHHLDFILAQLADKPIKDNEIKAIALIGLYQLGFMRVKPHAAVSETIQAIRKKNWAKPLINALLRTYLRQQDVLEQQLTTIPSAAFSHPNWLIKEIQQHWPMQSAFILSENNKQAPMVLRVNSLKTSRKNYLELLNQQNISATTLDHCASAILMEKPVNVDQLPNFSDGWVSVQDSAAQLAASLLSIEPAQRVLDVCAAPGGKMAHCLEIQPNLQELVAVDIDASRMQRVRENMQRIDLQANIIIGDATQPDEWWDGKQFDRILIDAPCSATGVIRRHPDIKLLRKPEDIDQLRIMQKNILNAIWPLLTSGGILLYATCSILKQENEQQIAEFLTYHADAEHLTILATWGHSRPYGRQILTGEDNMDGFYYALLCKK